MAEPRAGLLDRELLLASAGSGKTYQLSSRLIGLLAAGVPPQEILASTFTRKAAGEILERVLLRLARAVLDEGEARELADSLPPGIPGKRLGSADFGLVLVRTLNDLHRLQVHTLDAFFHRVVRSFSLELGLPGEWTVADEPTGEELRSRALEEALRKGDRGVLTELVRLAGRGDADRSVHDLLLGQVSKLHDLYRERAPGAEDLWGAARDGDDGAEPRVVMDAVLDELAAMELPLTKGGTPNKLWASNVEGIVKAAGDGDWEALLECGLVKRVVEGGEAFARAPIPPGTARAIHDLVELAAHRMRRELGARVRALGRFVPDYDARLSRLQRARGAYGFRDLTLALVGAGSLEALDEVHYRLDGRIRHVLLDEFQDTSTAQWAALEPLVGEILSGYEGERAAFVVADPKQSIYGWRDGEPRILQVIQDRYGLAPSTLARSWRSSPVVLDLVNRVFSGIADNPVLAGDDGIREMAERWSRSFELHEAASAELPGFVTVETAPGDPEGAPAGDALIRRTARRVAEIHRQAPGATVGILTRRNSTVARLIAELRELGVEASEEGGVPVADAAVVVAALALLRMADHPDDGISRYLVAHSPLGPLVGLEKGASLSRADEVARSLRERLVAEGYGPVIAQWVRTLEPRLPARELGRLRKLMELAFRWDDGATLRPGDFVRMAECSRAEDAGSHPVRIMTVYRAKGLEFDVVVLPELDDARYTPGGLPAFVPERADDGAGPVARILPGVKQGWEPLFPELGAAAAQHRESRIRDCLSALYVSLTRARYAVHVFMEPDPGGRSGARSDARLLRAALLPDGPEAPADTVLWTAGDPQWSKHVRAMDRIPEAAPPGRPPARPAPRWLRGSDAPRRRLLPHHSPSELEGGEQVPLADVVRPIPREALERGTLVHLWLEELEWLEEGWAGEDELLARAGERTPGVADPAGLLRELREWLEAPAIRDLLRRGAHPPGTTVEREVPFLARDGAGVLQGTADRVIRVPDPGGERLVVVDWKTDRIADDDEAALARRAGFYAPQMEAYCRALARIEGVEPDRVEGALVFLQAGIVRRV